MSASHTQPKIAITPRRASNPQRHNPRERTTTKHPSTHRHSPQRLPTKLAPAWPGATLGTRCAASFDRFGQKSAVAIAPAANALPAMIETVLSVTAESRSSSLSVAA